MPPADLEQVTADAVRRCRRRSPAWWREPAGPDGATRADLVSRLVDTLASYEAGKSCIVPRPGYDITLADQLAVIASDLITALRRNEVSAATAADAVTKCLETMVLVDG